MIADISVTVFAIQGNHECRPENIPTYHLIDFCGGKAYVEDEFPNIIFAKDGEIYDLQERKALVIGGAYSPDKSFRLATGRKW